MATVGITANTQKVAKSKHCAECGVDPGLDQQMLRRLHERLEYSELQNLKLSSECARLRKELREAEFKGRYSVSRTPPPGLPNEILHKIFSLATRVEGDLVSPHWRTGNPYPPWSISSQTRRSIPLVCRQWHVVGLEYLYQHLVIFAPSQIIGLLYTLEYLVKDPVMCNKRLRWIRGLECILLREDSNEAAEFLRQTNSLIFRLPHGRLRVFGFEDGHCEQTRSSQGITEMVMNAVQKAEGCLEVLHLPCIKTTDMIDFTGFSQLGIVSLIRGRWEDCRGCVRDEPMPSFLTHSSHTIHTLSLNWRRKGGGGCLDFLKRAVCLQTIHVVTGRTAFLEEDLDGILGAVPQLRTLILTLLDGQFWDPPVLNRDVVTHESLEEVTLEVASPFYEGNAFAAKPIFSKLQSAHLPNLKRITIRGQYPEGCIDGRDVMTKFSTNLWEDAIEACAQHDVDLVDEEGNPIHLWDTRHGIKFPSGNEDAATELSSSEGEYWELSSSGYSGSSVASDEIISDDSEDSPYTYGPQPDLDYDDSSEDLDY